MVEQQILTGKKYSRNRILLIVIDGLGGLRHPDFDNKSELEYARLPNLDALVQRDETVTGIHYPVARGYIPGSAAGHFGLFGYNPLHEKHQIGRGILEAFDLDIPVKPGDVVARLNFATMKDGVVTDRRAGRISDARSLAKKLNESISVNGAKVKVVSTTEHRGVLFLQHEHQPLGCSVTPTDPGETGKPVMRCEPISDNDPASARTATVVSSVVDQSLDILKDEESANCILLRGFSGSPTLPTFPERYGLDALAIANYPLYRGIAKLLGMTVCDSVASLTEKAEQLRDYYDDYTFFFFHYKEPDTMGEDGDFLGKVEALEDFDRVLPSILQTMDLSRDVIAITGDHSTPSIMGAHSHHSVPLLLFSAQNKGYDKSRHFDERDCTYGTFGRVNAVELMGCLLARAGKLTKFDL